MSFRLTRQERGALLAGGLPKIVREEKPAVEPGDVLELAHSKPKKYWDPTTEEQFAAPREPVLWLTITKVVRDRRGSWVLRYDVMDKREQTLLLARGSGYTTDPEQAIDKAEARVPQKDRQRLAVEARARYAAQKEQRDVEARRRQERALKLKLKVALNGLPPVTGQLLLADIEKRIEQAIRDGSADQAA